MTTADVSLADTIRYLEGHLHRCLRELDVIKSLAGVSASGMPMEPPAVMDEPSVFTEKVSTALESAFGTTGDFSEKSFQNLYRYASGDGDTVCDLIMRLGARGTSPESLGNFIIGIVRKQGIQALRSERGRRAPVITPGPSVVPAPQPTPLRATAVPVPSRPSQTPSEPPSYDPLDDMPWDEYEFMLNTPNTFSTMTNKVLAQVSAAGSGE